jgi:hypothetical protein
MITADTITDEQIRHLWASGAISEDTAHEALNSTVWPRERAAARARCAALLVPVTDVITSDACRREIGTMTTYKECVECHKRSEGDEWRSGEVCLFGMLFACSADCAKAWATRHAAPGFRPGEPGFQMEIEP